MHTKKTFFIPLIFLALTVPAMPTMGAENPSAREQITTMDEVVVTATKTAEKRKDIANPLVIISPEEVSETPADNVGQLLSGEAGIDWRSRGNYGGAGQEIQIRGMNADETQVLVNGLNVNSPSLGRADLATVPMNWVDHVEVVKGAGSLLYGSGAMAGTVNVFTKRPEKEAHSFTASAGYGSDATFRLEGEQGMYVTDVFGYFVTAGHSETDGQRDNSDLNQNDASLNLIFDRGDLLQASLFGSIVDRSFGVPGIDPPAGSGNHFIDGVQFYSDESASTVDNGTATDTNLVAKISSRPDPRLKVSLQASRLYNRSINSSRYNASGGNTLAGTGVKSTIINTVTSIEGDAEIAPIADLKFLIGADYHHHDWQSGSRDLDTSGASTGDSSTTKAALHYQGTFIEAQYRPVDMVKLLAGIRHEKHSTFGSENIPRFGLIVNPYEGTALKLNHGKFFKAPTPNDLFWPSSDFAQGNIDLEAQTGWHSDATLEQSLLNNQLFATLGYFDWHVDGKITWAENPAYPGPFGNKWTPTNLYSGEGSGWEASIEFKPNSPFLYSLSYTYTDAEEEIAPGQWRDAQYMAKNRLKGKVTWYGDQGTTATLIGRYVGERDFYRSNADTSPTDTLDSYLTMDLRVDHRLTDNWQLILDLTNIFDEKYDTYVGSFVDSTGSRNFGFYPGSSRSILGRVTYSF